MLCSPRVPRRRLVRFPGNWNFQILGDWFIFWVGNPPSFKEALQLLFQSMAITGVTPPSSSKATPFSSQKRGSHEVE